MGFNTLTRCLLLTSLTCLMTSAVYFEDGYDHHYTYSSESDVLGMHNVTTVIKFRIRAVNSTSGDGVLNQLMIDSFIQHSEHGYVADNPLKWDLNNRFYFTISPAGLVHFVHFHPEEIHELLTLKKVLASTLTTRVQVEDSQSWMYDSMEEDHTGHLGHTYEASRTSEGMRLLRSHRSLTDVHRMHYKTTHLDDRLTPQLVEAIDNITLQHSPNTVSTHTVEGAAEIEEEHSGEFPKISSISRSKLKLMLKSKHSDPARDHALHEMHRDSISVKPKPLKKVPLAQVEADIRKFITCIHSYTNKYERNRTECVHQLRELITSLEKQDFLTLGKEALTRSCDVNDTVCVDERNLFIDLIAREGSAEAQLLVLEHVMSQPNVTEEDIRRCLFHTIAIQNPISELVILVETLCFQDGHEPGDTPALTKTRKRACLSLGAMAKSLHDRNTTESDRIVGRIEDWLGHHNETKSSDIIKPRRRRSIIQHDTPARKHIETKMVLLHSLGNAGKQRSLRHILSYMEPNVGVTAWRRAAINGLRHFSCNTSADALLTSIIHDHDEVVRKTAHTVFKKHPKADDRNFTIEHETEVISKNYTYPIVSRVRRSLLQALEEGIHVMIQPPGIDWQKTIGTSNIGASFGLIIRNILDLKLALLSGHFMVDVHDEAYAEAHVGMINFKVDIVKALICFKGHIEYDLNVLKDFGINSLSDLVKIFDKIMDKIVNPIINGVMAFKKIFTMFKDGKTLTNVVNEIVDIVKNLPTRLGEVANRMRDFVKELFSISANTVIEEIKSIVKEVSDFIDGIKTDALKFYNDVVDVVTMALPYTAKKIMDAIKSIVEAIKKIFNNPMQAMTSMSRAIIDIKVAVTMAIDVKNKVVEACLFIKGRVVEWINTAKKIPAILGRIKDVFKKLTDSIKDGVQAIKNEAKSAISDGISAVKDTMHDVVHNLTEKWEHVFAPLQPLIEFVTPFVEIFKSIMDAIKGIKLAYQEIKKAIETSRSLVQKVFGPKFDRNFPTKRRDAFGECPSGVWPSTANGAYGTTGVDIILGEGQTVHMPVNGILKSYSNDRKVVVKPSDPEFKPFEIVVENIDADGTLNGKTLKAGDKIGKATTARVCKERKLSINVNEVGGNPQDPNTDKLIEITIGEAKKQERGEWMSTVASRGKNSIHVSVRKAQEDELPDADYDYTDPSPFLDRLVPIPKWIQDCNDYEFRYIGQTTESGESDEDEDPDEKQESHGRKPDAGSIDDMLGDEDTTYRPADSSLYDPTSFGDSLKESLKEQAKLFAEMFKQALFGNNPKIPNILEIVDVNSKTVEWIIEKLNATSEIGKKFIGILKQLACTMKAEPSDSPATLTPNLAINFLKLHNLKFNFGGFDFSGGLNFGGSGGDDNSGGFKFGPLKFGDPGQLSLSMAELPGKICPMFKDAIAKGFGHMCYVHENCLGLSCNIPVPLGPTSKVLHASVALVPSELKIEISVRIGQEMGTNYTIQPNGEDQHMEVANSFLFKVVLIVNAKFDGPSVTLTAELQVCNDLFMSCAPPIELFHNIKLIPNAVRHKRATGSCSDVSLRQTPITTFMMQLSEFYLLNKDVTATLETVRNQVVEQLLKEMADKFMAALTEFPNKVDFCVSANIPVPPFDITFFDIRQHFMVGPVPLSLGFGAGGAVGLSVKVGLCVVSMTTQLTLTPWVGGKVWGDAAIDIGFARGGIRLVGYLLETQFPMTTELVFSKYPIDVGAKMDLVLTPLRLELKAFAELFLIFTTVKVFEGTIWKYQVPTIRQNIFTKNKRDDDPSPPNVLPTTFNERRRRAGPEGCVVNQVYNRPYYDTAFTLEMFAQDEVSEVKLTYAIGTHKGGTNVQAWTEMGGNTLLVPAKLPGGIPLYWTVSASNTQGLSATVQCSLNTYDSTLPDGRVEHPYKYSSHPSKMVAFIIVAEDSPLKEMHYKAVGFSPGQYGNQFVGWEETRLDHSPLRQGVAGPLQHFTTPMDGKLIANVIKTVKPLRSPDLCAELCMNHGSNCVSFSYEYHSETCDLHDQVAGADAYLRISGTYKNYERLGIGYRTSVEYDNLPLTQGTQYFVNAKVTNVLGYVAYLIGEGTMVDFTPPEPGLIMNNQSDFLRADQCNASVSQRCLEVTWLENNRIIIDGSGSGTVFNGHQPVQDELYTLTNHYVSANWKGFHDDESGIYAYTWAVGKSVCSSDVVPFTNPYAHLTDPKFWTDSGFQKGIHLPDGPYYVTVQALNGAELGGSLVTTVCHSTPFIVDTSPPVFHKVTDIIYDEDFDLIAIYYNATDDLSKIAHAEFGLGKTKYDVQLKAYGLHAPMEREDPFVAVKDLGLQEGIPAWIRIRVTNNVDLFTAGHGDEPILIDRSPPIPGAVMDGDRLRRDRQFQADDRKICAQWIDFFDPESGIDRFLWGVGTAPQLDDIVKFHNLTRYEKSSCVSATLKHNITYFSTVLAFNSALNSKPCNSSSDGVLVDTTPPIAGIVLDGITNATELKYSSETVSKHANWRDYYDPESGITNYKVSVYINNEKKKTFETGTLSEFEDHTISMEHKDEVYFEVNGVNGADLEAANRSDGFMVDHTPPIMTEISDNKEGNRYQSDKSNLNLKWDFFDIESGIGKYRTVIYESRHGIKQKHWPATERFNETKPITSFNGKMDSTLGNLNMEDGVTYSLHVTAFDGALLATAHESTGVMIDTTIPSTPRVKVGLSTEDEEVNDHGQVLHNDQYGIRLSWSSRDSESGIANYEVAIGTKDNNEKILQFTDFGTDTTAYISNIFLEPFSANNTLYVVTVKASNGAKLVSSMGVSKDIFVQKANIPGVVFDGRTLFEDESFTTDHTSIAASFYGFESESCDIINYDWAIGTTEFGTDILTYTNYGLVMLNDTHGQCQIHTELFEDVTYYITVRAVTGCHEEYIVSSSDGITLDRVAPKAIFNVEASNDTIVYIQDNVIYQSVTDSIAIVGNVSDSQEIKSLEWGIGSLPSLADIKPFNHDLTSLTSVATLVPGEAVFVTMNAVDKAGNHELASSFAVIADTTAPEMIDLECTQFISVRKSIVTCSWLTIVENESILKESTISIGSTQTDYNILDSFVVHKDTYSFTRDLFNHISQFRNTTAMFITVTVSNVVGHKTIYGREVVVDRTAPVADRLDVLTSTSQGNTVDSHQKCQLPRGYVEVKLINVVDEEAPIDVNRYEIALGSKPLGTDYLEYHPVIANSDGIFFVNGFRLNQGDLFYATMRIYNKAGLSSEVSSGSVVVSQTPFLEVRDGTGEQDIDFQSTPNLIQGSWKYSDACPIGEAKWKIESLSGNTLFDFQSIPNAGQVFYNDEVQLENGMKYIVTVQTIDFLGRVKTARSDGVTVRIQPPFPGLVRDGIDKDLTYQFSTTELSTNWDNFGDKSSDPTQSIHHYEVAIGNDRRYEKTRSNVHYFVDVGLNNSYIFSHLNLTSKLVRYYITVRAYSMAGGFTEGYSNGIRVGFNDDIVPGSVSVNKYQSSVDSMAISWSGFQSDIDIIDYKVAISSHEDIITNDTVVCNIITANKTMYDVALLRSVGLDEYSKLLGLALLHNSKYYVTVVAEDEAGMCTGITSDWVLVDTTPPEFGKLYINDIESSTVIYVKKPSEMQIKWEMHDHESGINIVLVQLFECSSCMSTAVTSENCYLIDKNSVKNDTKTAFYELQMNPQKAYYVKVEVTNEANLVTRVQSLSILVDTTPPLFGEVKITDDWHDVVTFQQSTDRLSGMLPIALTETDYLCPSQTLYFPVSGDIRIEQVMEKFDDEFLVVNNTGAYLGIGYNSDLTDITKSGVISESMNLQNGNYSFNVRAAKGYRTITTVAIVTDQIVIPFIIENKPEEVEFDFSKFENVTGLEAGNSTQDDNSNITTTTVVPNVSSIPNNSTNGSKSDLENQEYGIGIHILGYKIGKNKFYHHVFWAKSKYTSSLRWFQTDKDLNSEQSFIFKVAKKSEYLDDTVDVTLIVAGEEKVSISGFKFVGAVKLAALTWTEESYKPPLNDIYKPFYSDAVLNSIYIPDVQDKLCRHGRGFYDGESGIKELWIGASDNNVVPGSIRAFELYKTFCFPCLKPCDTLCNETCTAEKLLDGFNMINIDLTNIHLESSENSPECANITSDKKCNGTAYYLNAKLVNFAGEETFVFSNGIQIDTSPPDCEYVKCTSPEYSEDQPTNFTGSSSTIGAYWNCTEKTSQIVKYTVQIINKESGAIIMDYLDVGLKNKATFSLNNGTFEHEKYYDVRVSALNTAGLTSIASCSVQVILFPPDVSKVISGPLYTNRTNTADDAEPYWTESQSQIGIQWQGGTPDIEFYEWRVGTQSDGEDLFPPSKVGVNTTGSSAIVHGKIHYNDKYINRTVSEYRDILNMSSEERNNFTSASEAEKSFYQMEPGRCVHQSLYAIGLSHLKSNIKKETVCIKRSGDVNLKTKTGASMLRAVRPIGSLHWMETNNAVAADIVVESELTTGGITLGTLTQQDVQETYGSAATAEYRPFISNIETTQRKTSRLLRNRIHHLCDINFFLSPAPSAEASRVTIHVTVRPGCEKDPVYQPALVFWDTEKEVWVHIDEGCNEILSANFSSGIYSSMICPEFNSAVRKKRDASIKLESPMHYSLVKIGKTFINYPPKIVSETLDMTEDEITDLTIETEDPEDDSLVYKIVDEPENLQCNITSDGNLRCRAIEDDFYGEDDVTVEVTETDLPAFEQPMSHTKQLKLVVQGTPDKTERFFFDSNETFFAEKRPSFRHTILVNANRSSTHYAGRIVLADVDGDEVFAPYPRFNALGDAAFSLKRLSTTSDIPLANYTTKRYRSVEAYDVEFEYSPDLQGNMTLDFIAKNADDSYTPGVTIDVFVMENPCIHGQCHHPTLGYDACEDPGRSLSFSGFECVCEPGYIGDWCQIEIDECQSSPCSSMYDCEDLANDYQCNINIPKLLAVIVCPLIALIVLVYVLRRVIVRLRYIKLSRSRVGLMEDSGRQIGDNRPATSSGVHVDDKDDVSSEDDDVKNWRDNPAYEDSSIFTANPLFLPAGKALPPHHANFSTFKGVQEKPKPFPQFELGDFNGERMRPIQPRHVDVSNRRFDVTMLAEPSETSMSTSRASSVSSLGRIPKPGPIVKIPLHQPDEFDSMIEKMKNDAGLTNVET